MAAQVDVVSVRADGTSVQEPAIPGQGLCRFRGHTFGDTLPARDFPIGGALAWAECGRAGKTRSGDLHGREVACSRILRA